MDFDGLGTAGGAQFGHNFWTPTLINNKLSAVEDQNIKDLETRNRLVQLQAVFSGTRFQLTSAATFDRKLVAAQNQAGIRKPIPPARKCVPDFKLRKVQKHEDDREAD
jgi:hypothetical protein